MMMYFSLMIEFDIVLFPYEKKREKKKKKEAMTSLEAQTSSKRSKKIKVQIWMWTFAGPQTTGSETVSRTNSKSTLSFFLKSSLDTFD